MVTSNPGLMARATAGIANTVTAWVLIQITSTYTVTLSGAIAGPPPASHGYLIKACSKSGRQFCSSYPGGSVQNAYTCK